MNSLERLTAEAEREWLENWVTGPTEDGSTLLPPGTRAPAPEMVDHTDSKVQLSDFWTKGPALVMFWRHFGCTCGAERADRLKTEYESYLSAGLTPVIIAQGEPERADAYRIKFDIPCPVLCDPDLDVYRMYGVGQWQVEQVLYDAPQEYWEHPHRIGVEFQDGRREQGRPPVDDPWRAAAEFVVGPNGVIRLSYAYQYCVDYPDPRVFTTAAQLVLSS